ncbi:MAG: hypothetical protein ACRCVJ_18470 [Clostridium sp.]|uniref:hypothetical protein n=1 Tax=Clostridium sp. TaxID=1506 RepID=UPI003F3F27EF
MKSIIKDIFRVIKPNNRNEVIARVLAGIGIISTIEVAIGVTEITAFGQVGMCLALTLVCLFCKCEY